MKKLAPYVTIMLLVTALLVACRSDSEDEPAALPSAEPTVEPAVEPTEVSQPLAPADEPPTAEPAAYPALPAPAVQEDESGYPAPEPESTYDPYPGGLAVILHPLGRQCEDAIYADLAAATAALEEAGIMVLAAEEIAVNVCDACSCPTSKHYRMQINPEDLNKASELGWFRG